MRKFHYAFLVAAIGIAVALAFYLPPDEAGGAAEVAGLLALLTGVSAVLSRPSGVAFMKKRRRTLAVIGWLVCAAGIAVGLCLPIYAVFQPAIPHYFSDETAMYGGLMIALLGFMIARLPRMAGQVEQSRAELTALKQTGRSPTDFRAAHEGLNASLSVLRDWPTFLQIAAPWALLLSGSLYWLILSGDTLGHDAARAELLLVALLVLLILLFVSIPTVAAAWFRWVILGQRPPHFLALPNRTTLSLLWRMWIFSSVLGAADRLTTAKATEIAASWRLPNAATVGTAAGWGVDILAVMLASSLALRLPALAVSDAAFTRITAAVQGRKMWPSLPVGLVLSLAPFFIVGWMLDELYDASRRPAGAAAAHAPAHLDPLIAGLLAPGLLVTFAAVASAATFLSRAYIAAKARNGFGTASA